MKRSIGRLVTIAAILLFVGGSIPAQDASRQARLREHERRIRELIERRRQEQEAAQGQAAAPTEAVTEQRSEPQEDLARAISNVVMGLKFSNADGESSYNIVVRRGEEFISEVYLFNIDANPLERIRLALKYDKRFIAPLAVFDSELRTMMSDDVTFRHDTREAILNYSGTMRQKITNTEVVVLRIQWRALRDTPYTGIDFHFDPLEREELPHTAVFARGRNILGTDDDPMDGVLSGGLMIDLPTEEEKILQGKAEELRELYLGSVASLEEVGLELIGPSEPPRVGDPFRVRVALNNPSGALIDALNFYVKFDPEVMEVIDVDRFNWIQRGVNVHDGPYQRYFPWDMHKRNEVRNDVGLINYQKSLSNGSSLPGRVFADIYFRAKAPANRTDIFFVKGRLSDVGNTSVRYFGFERLNLGSELSQPEVIMTILPAPVEVADTSPTQTEVITSTAATVEEIGVRRLTLERN